MRKSAWIVAGVVAVGLATPALSQNIWISQLYNQVLDNADTMGPSYALDSFGVQRMFPGSTMRIPIDVPANSALTILGDCDEDCVDMNFVAYDGAGNHLGEDLLDDNYPVVNIQTGDNPRVQLDISMVNCDAAYCYAAYSVFVSGL